ncbi:maleate cis-trans isomerase family protein [Falsiroseomonas ponticola]|uniref:maleate cis-trans isomerase family protein n=1 Tax=Falsiroseomonas ponticola TaxID=2786951 RepID=UPI0019339A7B|nr:arylmalonate decarboxylase [Roseomonas ponticola]
MPDVLGWRGCFGVVTPSTNTVVQPEYDTMRPRGITNHVARMHIANDPLNSDADFDTLISRIDAALEAALERVLTAQPDRIVLGISAESIWGGGLAAARAIQDRVDRMTGGLPFTQAADALPAALKALGITGPVGLVTPYFPVAHSHLVNYLAEIGCEVVAAKHLQRPSPVGIGLTPLATLRDAINEVNRPEVRAIIQFGANLPMMHLAAQAEAWLGKPVLAINAVTYWHALRSHGITDRIAGCGRLLEEH